VSRALILTYHAIERGPPPLCLAPELLRDQLDRIVEFGIPVVSLDRLARGLRAGGAPERCVAITFDDGFRSVVDVAAPLLAQRGLPATVFCVAGHLGGANDWPSQPARAPRRELADAAGLTRLAAQGFEIGAHGLHHAPLTGAPAAVVHAEAAESKAALEQAVGAPVRWFAYPYGAVPAGGARVIAQSGYEGACAAVPRAVTAGADPFALPRVDAHYLRSSARLRRALDGGDAYLALRRAVTGARRALRPDFSAQAPP
jgi:peptidoglycan/xylan/chitin deacetylase (PgdA/CDA1 family)